MARYAEGEIRYGDDDPTIGDQQRAIQRKTQPRGTGTGSPTLDATEPGSGDNGQSISGAVDFATSANPIGVGIRAARGALTTGAHAINAGIAGAALPFAPAADAAVNTGIRAFGYEPKAPYAIADATAGAMDREAEAAFGGMRALTSPVTNAVGGIARNALAGAGYQPSAPAQAAPHVMPPAIAALDNTDRIGSLAPNRLPDYGPGVTVPVPAPRDATAVDTRTDAERNNAPFHQQYLALQARQRGDDAASRQTAQDAQVRGERLASLPGYRETEQAKSAARVANFRATDGADVVLAGGNDAYADQRASIRAAAVDANRRLASVEAANLGAGTATPRRDFVGEDVAQQDALNRTRAENDRSALASQQLAQNTLTQPVALEQQKTALAGGKQALAEGAQRLQVQQRINDLGSKLAAETDPAKRGQLEQSLLASLGKDTKKKYIVTNAGGGTDPTDVSGIRRMPDNIVVTDPDTGKSEVVPLTSQRTPSKDEALAQAKEELKVKGGASREAVNARLKSWGYPEI